MDIVENIRNSHKIKDIQVSSFCTQSAICSTRLSAIYTKRSLKQASYEMTSIEYLQTSKTGAVAKKITDIHVRQNYISNYHKYSIKVD